MPTKLTKEELDDLFGSDTGPSSPNSFVAEQKSPNLEGSGFPNTNPISNFDKGPSTFTSLMKKGLNFAANTVPLLSGVVTPGVMGAITKQASPAINTFAQATQEVIPAVAGLTSFAAKGVDKLLPGTPVSNAIAGSAIDPYVIKGKEAREDQIMSDVTGANINSESISGMLGEGLGQMANLSASSTVAGATGAATAVGGFIASKAPGLSKAAQAYQNFAKDRFVFDKIMPWAGKQAVLANQLTIMNTGDLATLGQIGTEAVTDFAMQKFLGGAGAAFSKIAPKAKDKITKMALGMFDDITKQNVADSAVMANQLKKYKITAGDLQSRGEQAGLPADLVDTIVNVGSTGTPEDELFLASVNELVDKAAVRSKSRYLDAAQKVEAKSATDVIAGRLNTTLAKVQQRAASQGNKLGTLIRTSDIDVDMPQVNSVITQWAQRLESDFNIKPNPKTGMLDKSSFETGLNSTDNNKLLEIYNETRAWTGANVETGEVPLATTKKKIAQLDQLIKDIDKIFTGEAPGATPYKSIVAPVTILSSSLKELREKYMQEVPGYIETKADFMKAKDLLFRAAKVAPNSKGFDAYGVKDSMEGGNNLDMETFDRAMQDFIDNPSDKLKDNILIDPYNLIARLTTMGNNVPTKTTMRGLEQYAVDNGIAEAYRIGDLGAIAMSVDRALRVPSGGFNKQTQDAIENFYKQAAASRDPFQKNFVVSALDYMQRGFIKKPDNARDMKQFLEGVAELAKLNKGQSPEELLLGK